MTTCPFCAELIKEAAIVCKHCGRDLDGPQSPAPLQATTKPGTDQTMTARRGLWLTTGTTHWIIVGVLVCGIFTVWFSTQNWRGVPVSPETRCSPYSPEDYSYPQSVESDIIGSLGGIWSPYTGQSFASRHDTDIEHIVALSEAHDSGLCSASAQTRRAFATDLLNLTLASPTVNRSEKRDQDAVDWLPDQNRCWFAHRVVQVRQKYQLTINRQEADVLDGILASCTSTTFSHTPGLTRPVTTNRPTNSLPADIAQWDDNGNGRITCAEARAHGIAPVLRTHSAYPYMRDGDGDGIVCESGGGTAPRANTAGRRPSSSSGDPLELYDDNGNGRITCTEARRYGITPVRSSHPAYRYMNDRDNDGIVCE